VSKNHPRTFPLALAVIPAAALLVFGPLLNAPFFFDDLHTIRDNPFIAQHLSPLFFLTHPESGSHLPGAPLRPLLTFSYAIDWRLGHGRPFLFHLVNLILHAMNAILVAALTRETKTLKPHATLAGLLFLLLPLHTGLIAYASNRSTLLSSSFLLAGILVFARGLHRPTGKAAVPAIFLLGLAGLLVKETAAVLGAAIILWAFIFADMKAPATRRFTLAAAAAAFAGLALFLLYRRAFAAPTLFPPARPWPVWAYLAAQVRVYFTYLSLIAFPVNLSLEHDAWMPHSPSDLASAAFILAGLGLIAIIGAALALFRRAPEISFAGLASVLFLLPTSSVIPLVMVVNENRPYLSSLILVWPLLAAYEAARRQRPLAAALIVAVLASLFAAGGLARARAYRDELAILTDAAKKAPGLARPLVNLGIAQAGYGRFDDAQALHLRALRLDPCSAAALTNLANLARVVGSEAQAEALLRKALVCDPRDTAAMLNLADLLSAAGRPGEATVLREAARRLQPLHPAFRGLPPPGI
jgi:hypothetical protein